MLSTFGVMFTRNPTRSAAELLRVCRPGGRIGLANWTPEGFVGRMFRIVAATSRRPPASPHRWSGAPKPASRSSWAQEPGVVATRRLFTLRYRSPADFFDTFRTLYGPLVRAWEVLDEDGRTSLRSQLEALANDAGSRRGGALAVPSEYLEVVATRR